MSNLGRYWSIVRRLRVVYFLNNLMYYGKLKRNKPLYRKFGVDKSVIGSLAHKDITHPSNEVPWLDQPDAMEKLKSSPQLASFPEQWQEELLKWPDRGYMILKNFTDNSTCDKINSELVSLLDSGELKLDEINPRIMNAWKKSGTINQLIHEKTLNDFLSFTLGREVLPFQTISFFKGSNQETHSDSIHMTTEPLGYLVATWIALEDITADCGPLHYYPGSQKLPYVMGEDFPHTSTLIAVDEDFYVKYEKEIAGIISEKKLTKDIFLAKKGDLLVWHANILHGGEPITNENSTRKSLVTHYFCKGDVICYHEISQRPAILPD